jgi:hypothetical protein
MVEIPDLKAKIYDMFIDILDDDWKNESREYLENAIDDALDEMNITFDKLYDDIMIGVEQGYSINEQLELVKKAVLHNRNQ